MIHVVKGDDQLVTPVLLLSVGSFSVLLVLAGLLLVLVGLAFRSGIALGFAGGVVAAGLALLLVDQWEMLL